MAQQGALAQQRRLAWMGAVPVRAPRRAEHLQKRPVGHARVAPRGVHVGVAEEGLEGALGDAAGRRVRGERVLCRRKGGIR